MCGRFVGFRKLEELVFRPVSKQVNNARTNDASNIKPLRQREIDFKGGPTMPKKKAKRDIEKTYSTKQMIAKLRRLADCLEQGKRFQIQIQGERFLIPADAVFNIEHERGKKTEEVEFQFKWKL